MDQNLWVLGHLPCDSNGHQPDSFVTSGLAVYIGTVRETMELKMETTATIDELTMETTATIDELWDELLKQSKFKIVQKTKD